MTSAADEFVAGRELAEVERFTAKSADGTEVDAWLVRPPGFDEGKKYPTLLTIDGGPFSQYGTGFFDEVQVYAGAGYCVLFSNPRGGSGYSEEWGRAIRGSGDGSGPGWGSVDYEDVMGVVDTALEQYPFLDAERLGVLGGSYGGYLTSWVVGHTKRFKAALSERSVNHLVSAFGSSDLFWIFERQFGGPMWENVDDWLRMSPATYARDIETPLLVVHSENDLRCNIEQGEHLFTLLRLLGKETEMLRFPAEGHELSRSGSPIHRVQRFEAILEWFGRGETHPEGARNEGHGSRDRHHRRRGVAQLRAELRLGGLEHGEQRHEGRHRKLVARADPRRLTRSHAVSLRQGQEGQERLLGRLRRLLAAAARIGQAARGSRGQGIAAR